MLIIIWGMLFQTDKKQQALNAFKSASEMDFDKKIQEMPI